MVVQWLRTHDSTAGGKGSIPGWGTSIPHAVRDAARKKKGKIKKKKVNIKQIFKRAF